MTYSEKSFLSQELRPFPYIVLSSGNNYRRRANDDRKVRIWIQGAVHGNEPASEQALLALLGKFNAEPAWAADVLKRCELVVMPQYNVDGAFYFQATTNYGRYYQASDGLFSAAKNLNINQRIRQISEELFTPAMGAAMEKRGLRWEPYVTGPSSTNDSFVPRWAEAGTDGKIGRNAMGLTQAVTFLIETRGIRIADQEFQRRVASALTLAGAVIDTAAYNADRVYDTIENGRKDFISSKEPVVITDYSNTSIRTFFMVDRTTGAVSKIDTQFSSTTPAIANLTRRRPEAYIIPVAWKEVAERLRVYGLQVDTLPEPFSGSVEVLTVVSAKLDSEAYEGTVLNTVRTNTTTRSVTLPRGSYRVSTRQKNAGLAFVALEPENIDSFVSFNIVPLEVGDEYPIYRSMA